MVLRIIFLCAILFAGSFSANCQKIDALHSVEDELDLADSVKFYTVRNIDIFGNKRTRMFIVERELAVVRGGVYKKKELKHKIRQTREQLMNTALFVDVIVKPVEDGDQIDLTIELKERWYLFPVPLFRVVDRNWNVWIKEHNASIDRANIGVKITHHNATGLNDKFNFFAIGGYTQQLSFNYFRPYFDPKLRFGYNINFAYARNREVNYATHNNKLVTLDTSYFTRKLLHTNVGLSYRKGSRLRMQLRLGYTDEKFDSMIAVLNPDFLGKGSTRARYFDLTYSNQYYFVDYIPYPLRGWYYDISVQHRLANSTQLNMFQVWGKFLGTWEIMNKTWVAFQAAGIVRFPFNQPYYNSRMLGFGDLTMQGLEYYVADGAAGGMVRATLRKQFLQFTIKNLVKSKSHNTIPVRLFAKVYGNLGYAHNSNPGSSIMNNKLLRTGGIGLDIVTVYDWAIKLDFSFNQFDSGGKLYLHTQSDF